MAGKVLGLASQQESLRLWSPSLRVAITILISSMSLLFQAPAGAQETDWDVQFVNGPHQFDHMTNHSLCFDSFGNPHVAYGGVLGGSHIYYAAFDGECWHIDVVDDRPETKHNASLVLDQDGKPHLCYWIESPTDPDSSSLVHARKVGSSWQTESIDRVKIEYTGWASSITIDSVGFAHILYSGERVLRYAHEDGEGWHVSTIIETGVSYCASSIKPDSADCPHVAVDVNGNLFYATLRDESWEFEFIDENTGGLYVSLALDSADHPHIAYQRANIYQGFSVLKHAYRGNDSWGIESLPVQCVDATSHITCELDELNSPHIAYTTTWDELEHAYFDGSMWHVESVQDEQCVRGASLAADHLGRLAIAYLHDGLNNAGNLIRLARHNGSWEDEEVDSEPNEGLYTSIAIDPNDNPHITYHDSWDRDLMYAFWDGSRWKADRVIGEGTSGIWSSLVVDQLGRPHICCWSSSGTVYALRNGSQWTVEVIDSGTEGAWSGASLALDDSLHPHVAYRDDSGVLKYAHKIGDAWDLQAVDHGYVLWPSLGLDSQSRPHISYRGSNAYLKHAWLRGTMWEITNVETVACWHTSLALDALDRPHIAYGLQQAPLIGLFYAAWDGNQWTRECIDPWPAAARYPCSLALDNSNRPHIAYGHGDYYTKRLRFAWKDGSTWHMTVIDEGPKAGEYCSIALDGFNYRHVSYYDEQNRSLKYAFSTGEGLWTEVPLPNLTSLQVRIEGPVPCLGTASLALTTPSDGYIRLAVYDLMGRQTRGLHRGYLSEGCHQLQWDGNDDLQCRVPSGTYIVSAESGGQRVSKRIVLLR